MPTPGGRGAAARAEAGSVAGTDYRVVMSWLDLPPDPTHQPLTLSSAATNPADGLAPVLLSLVGAGLVGLWTTYGLEIWQVRDPAPLASILGVGIVERVQTDQGWAERGHLDPATGMLHVRHRDPHAASPRHVQLRQGTTPDERLDAWAGWQLERIADGAYRRGERWAVRQGGYSRSEFEVGVTSQQGPAGRQVVLTAMPERVGRVWHGKAAAVPSFARSGTLGESRAVTLPATVDGVKQAARLVVEVLKHEGIRPWEVMACFPGR